MLASLMASLHLADLQDALLRKYQDQIKQLESDLAAAQSSPENGSVQEERRADPALTGNGGILNTALLEQVCEQLLHVNLYMGLSTA